MTERLVLCGNARTRLRAKSEAVKLALSGPSHNITLRLEDISRRMVASVPDRLADLLELAAYVYCADQIVGRGGDTMPRMGAGWRRGFRFVIPVRVPALWSSPAVRNALEETLGFLSEDSYRFEFEAMTDPPPIQTYFPFGGEAPEGFRADEVILFSGGLDSLAGAIEELFEQGKRVALVSHRSSTKIQRRQHELVDALRDRAPGRLLHVPVRVSKKQGLGRDTMQRSRSFLFAALATVVARILGNRRVRFFENGIVSLNLPIAAQVLGSRATRTTHPRAIADFNRLFSAILGQTIAIDNPFAWKTKGEVVKIIADHECGGLIKRTVSCAKVHAMTTQHPHCGECSQCIDRRFGILAAGLGAHDPAALYKTDLLTGERSKGQARTMAAGYVRSASETRQMTDLAFACRYGEISRAIAHLPGPADDNARRIIDLHRRHADDVLRVMQSAVQRHASDLLAHTLPPSCMLVLAVTPANVLAVDGINASIVDPAEAVPEDRQPAESVVIDDWPSEIRIAIDESTRRVLIQGLPPLTGANYALLKALSVPFREDLASGRAPKNFRFLPAGKLAAELSIEEQSLRQRVSRCRKHISTQVEARCGAILTCDDLIENREWRGYRLNPAVRLLAPSEIEDLDS